MYDHWEKVRFDRYKENSKPETDLVGLIHSISEILRRFSKFTENRDQISTCKRENHTSFEIIKQVSKFVLFCNGFIHEIFIFPAPYTPIFVYLLFNNLYKIS